MTIRVACVLPCTKYAACLSAAPGVYVEAEGIVGLPRFDLPQGTLDMLILQAVAVGPIHGYAIAQRVQQVSQDALQIPQGSLYPALHRLENKGLLRSDWRESETGRDARFYTLTRKGRAQLKTETANWTRLADAIALILRAAQGSNQ